MRHLLKITTGLALAGTLGFLALSQVGYDTEKMNRRFLAEKADPSDKDFA